MIQPAPIALLLALTPGLLALPADAKKPTPRPAAAANSCTTCKERRPTLDPARFDKAEPGVKEGYEIARKYPATLDKIHCFCECAESPMFQHKTLLTCFTGTHAAGCGICLSEGAPGRTAEGEGPLGRGDQEHRRVRAPHGRPPADELNP